MTQHLGRFAPRRLRATSRLPTALPGGPGQTNLAGPPAKGRRGRRSLVIESLEERCFPSAQAIAALVSPDWFQDLGQPSAPRHAGSAGWSATDDSTSTQTVAAGRLDVCDWIVRFDAASLEGVSSAAQTASLLAGAGIDFEVLRGLGLAGQVLVRSSGASAEAAAAALAANARVASFERDVVQAFAALPNDPQFSALWGMENTAQTGGLSDADIDASAAWGLSTGSRGIVVGIIDTGVDYTHPDLAANIWTNPGEIAGNGVDDDHNGFVDDVHGYDFANNDGDPMDDNSHGTHVAGTIAGVGNNGRGVTGVNWSSSVMALKFLSGSGSGYTSDAVRAINYATMMRTRYGVNVRVTNNSWGGGGASAALGDAIRASGQAGILFVAAAGNSSRNNDAVPNYPSNYDSASLLAVAATDSADRLASFSNYGAVTVDLAAPGVSIYSTVPGGRYASYSGTSMATPHVAGVAALAWSVAPEATVAQVRDAILQGVDPIGSLAGRVATGGRLNAFNTLRLLATPVAQSPVVASLALSPATVVAGDSVVLTAQGVVDPDGQVAGVSFYLDSNGNGAWDATDLLVGSTTAVAGQQASIAISTAGLTPGQRLVFAAAVDNESRWSQAAGATLTVLARDDHGSTAPTATRAAVGSSVAGLIDRAGDRDWFAVRLIAGRNYVFETQLRGLADSFLTLYAPDGTTALASDDDGGPGFASRIAWTARRSGTHYLEVRGYDPAQTGAYGLTLASENAAPRLGAVARQYLSYTRDTLTVALRGADADRDALTYSAVAYSGDQPVPGLALSVVGNTLTIDPPAGFLGSFFVQATVSDGRAAASQTFEVRVVNYTPRLAAIPGQAMTGGHDLRLTLDATDRDGDPLAFSARLQTVDPIAQRAYTLDNQLGLGFAGSYFENFAGGSERYVLGNDSAWYYLLPNGELHRWAQSLDASPLVARLTADYYANPALLHDAPRPVASVSARDVTLGLEGNVLTLQARPGLTGSFQVVVAASDGRATARQVFQVTLGAATATAVSLADGRASLGTSFVDEGTSMGQTAARAVDHLAGSGRLSEYAAAGEPDRVDRLADSSRLPAAGAMEDRLDLLEQLAEELAAENRWQSAERRAACFRSALDDPLAPLPSVARTARHGRDSASSDGDLESEVLDDLHALLGEVGSTVAAAE